MKSRINNEVRFDYDSGVWVLANGTPFYYSDGKGSFAG